MMDTLNTRKIGNNAETLACDYLQKNGLQLVDRNFFCSLGEIDLIMRDGEYLVFVEVRSRGKNDGNVFESVDQCKQTKIIKAATFYLQKKRLFDRVDCRFDVIGIHDGHIEWLKDAFSADYY